MFRTILIRTLTLNTKNLNTLKCPAHSIKSVRQINCGVCLRNPRQTSKPNSSTSPAISSKYEVINEANSRMIENAAEENLTNNPYPILSDEYDGINLERGKSGVFDIDDLIDLLQRENSKDIFVAVVPPEINYVEHICVVSGCSKRHVRALAEFVRKVYKMKCNQNDEIPKIEGKESNEWMALDLGNIALHIFSDKTREQYDLETLWSVGPEYDDLTNKKISSNDPFENYSAFLNDLKPLS